MPRLFTAVLLGCPAVAPMRVPRPPIGCITMQLGGSGYVTPIGPFCPFRSEATAKDGPLGMAMDGLTNERMPKFATEMARLQLELASGGQPDVERVRVVAGELHEAEGEWQTMLMRMRLADDFQSRETFKMTEAWAERRGENLEMIGVLMRWEADCMLAFASGQPPLPPPPGVDLSKLVEHQAAQEAGGGGSVFGQMSAAQAVTSVPFTGDEPAFDSAVVREEYEALCRDHAKLIEFGQKYGTFDPLGKVAFIDAVEAVEARWDVFFSRFSLLGALNPTFKEQTDAFLGSMGMSNELFREALGEAHALMRADAEKERAAQS